MTNTGDNSMFEKKPTRNRELSGEYIVDFTSDSGHLRAILVNDSPIGTVAHVYLKNDDDFGRDPFLAPIHEYLMSNKLPKLSFIKMHYEN